MDKESVLIRITIRLFLASLIVAILILGKSFLIPFTWSLLIALSSLKMIEYVQQKTRLSNGLVIFIYLLFILVVLFSIGYFFYKELNNIFEDMPAISQQISDKLHSITASLSSSGIVIPDHIDHDMINNWVQNNNKAIFNAISAVGLNLWSVILILFYLFFLLYYRNLIPHFFSNHIKDKARLVVTEEKFKKALVLIRSYLYGLLMLTLVSAAMNFLVFLIFGLKFALFFAVFLAILNLIPFVGNLVGLIVIMLFAFLTKESALIPILIFISLFVVNFLQDNVVRPLLIGDKLKINAFTVFVAIIIGGIIWGVSGMILFIPIVGTIKILLEGNEKHQHYAIFFSDLPKRAKNQGKDKGEKDIPSHSKDA